MSRCQETCAPPSIAIALMAMRLAGYDDANQPPPLRQEAHCPLCYPKASAYYRIIDRITRGARP